MRLYTKCVLTGAVLGILASIITAFTCTNAHSWEMNKRLVFAAPIFGLLIFALAFLPVKFAEEKPQRKQAFILCLIALICLPFCEFFVPIFGTVGFWAWAWVIALKGEEKVVVENKEDMATQLEKLAGLRDKGILSNEEFEAQKKKLLA